MDTIKLFDGIVLSESQVLEAVARRALQLVAKRAGAKADVNRQAVLLALSAAELVVEGTLTAVNAAS